MSDCKSVVAELPGYVRGRLGAAAAAGVRNHLNACWTCRQEAERFGRLEALLAEHLPTIEPSRTFASTFANRLAAEIAAEETAPMPAESGWAGWLVRPWLIPVAVAATMAAILFAPWAAGPRPGVGPVASTPASPATAAPAVRPAAAEKPAAPVVAAAAGPAGKARASETAPPDELVRRAGLFVDFGVIEDLDEILSADSEVPAGKAG